jgi:hypothetical protein
MPVSVRKTKDGYIEELELLVRQYADKLTVKQIRTLIARYEILDD